MSRRCLMPVILAIGVFSGGARARAAGDGEITPVFMRTLGLQPGAQTPAFKLSVGAEGPLPHAVVFIATRPTADVVPDQPGMSERKPVPADITFRVAGKALPTWRLEDTATAYVLNLADVEANPGHPRGLLELQVNVVTTAQSVGLTLLSMPDPPALLGPSQSGPLSLLTQEARDPEIKAYFAALADEIAGRSKQALAVYQRLAGSEKGSLARFARRGVRMLAYKTRKRQLSGDFEEHLRWALYLNAAGFHGLARNEYNECRTLRPDHALSQYRAGALSDRGGYRAIDTHTYMERAARGFDTGEAADWDVLFVILQSRRSADSEAVSEPVLGRAELTDIKNNWLIVETMVFAATRGRIRLNTSFLDLQNDDQYPYTTYGDVPGPPDDLIERRGWFDSVISVRPRLAAEAGLPNQTIGGDRGPNGAALSAVFYDATWRGYLEQWHRQFCWAVSRAEVGPGYPTGDEAWSCGWRPNRDEALGIRAALHTYLTPAMCRRVDVVDTAAPGTHVRFWKVDGPYTVQNKRPAAGLPGRHVMDPIPTGPPTKSVVLDSDTDFIDLSARFPKAGWCRAVAKTWVYSPTDREVRMWIGQNDGAAVWVNGRCVHEGRQYSAGSYLDKNRVDTVASIATLKTGWNELRVVVESWPAPNDKGWGFSLRFCDWSGRAIPGLAYAVQPPPGDRVRPSVRPGVGLRYDWNVVRDDYPQRLPRLDDKALQSITGMSSLRMKGRIGGHAGGFALTVAGRTTSPSYRTLSAAWEPMEDRDVVLNNVLDWRREHVAALHFEKDGAGRDLLFLRPEAVDAYLTLLDEPRAATLGPNAGPPSKRVLGYVVVPGERSSRLLLVVEAILGDGQGWPVDEVDLLKMPLD